MKNLEKMGGKQQVSRIMRHPAVEDCTGFSRTTIYRKVRDGTFPQPVRIGSKSIGWFENEIADWQANLSRTAVLDAGEVG